MNIGRIKLCGGVMGGAKASITESVQYANEREQFNMPISSFGAIQAKLAEQCIRTFACESATYRATQNIEDNIQSLMESGMEKGEATLMEEWCIPLRKILRDPIEILGLIEFLRAQMKLTEC